MMMKKNQISSLLRDDHYHDHDHKKNKVNKVICSSNSSISSTSTTPNGQQAYDLTEDLILEIFAYLPPISLLRFKYVSKSLHSLISNPDFLCRNAVHQFRRQDPSPPPGILFRLGQELSVDSTMLINSPSTLDSDGDLGNYYYSQLLQSLIHYPEHDQPNDGNEKVKFTVMDSCNGLLLYLKCVGHQNPPEEKCIWYVCNPITKHYIKLPTIEEEEELGFKIQHCSLANLVFDPSLSLTYKVVIWLYESARAWRVYVYSSETRSWRLSVSLNNNDFAFHVLQYQFNPFNLKAVLLNGVLYWRTEIKPGVDVSLCYDVEKDSVWTLKFPKLPVEHVHRELFYFGVCGGGLRLIEKYYNPNKWTSAFPSSLDVMEVNQLQLQQQHQDQDQQDGNIDNDRDLWTVKYRVNIQEDGSYYANLNKEKSMFSVSILDLYKTTTTKAGGEEGEEVLVCILNMNDMLVISFNLSDNTFGKELRHNRPWLNYNCSFSGFTDVLRYDNITLFPLHGSLGRLE